MLQDVHWANGYFGYFPTYALGNLLASLFYERAQQAIHRLQDRIAGGDLSQLHEWLRENIHQHGKKFTPVELVMRVAGGEIDAEPFLSYLEKKYGEIYAL